MFEGYGAKTTLMMMLMEEMEVEVRNQDIASKALCGCPEAT